jgi:hypothetical protein
MKKLTFLFGLLLLPVFANGQSNTCCCNDDTTILCATAKNYVIRAPYTVIYDFKTGNLAFPKKGYSTLGRGDAIKIKIVNFNWFLYQVLINGKDSLSKGKVDTSTLFGAFSGISNIASLAGNMIGQVTAATAAVTQSLNAFNNEKYQMNAPTLGIAIQNLLNQPAPSPSKENPSADSLKNLLRKNENIIIGSNKRILSLKDRIDSLAFYGWPQVEKVLNDPYLRCDSFINVANGNIKTTLQQGFSKLKQEVRSFLDSISDYYYVYSIASAGYPDLVKTDTVIEIDSLIKKSYTQIIVNLTKVDSILSYKKLQTLVAPFDILKEDKPYFLSEPLFLTGDAKTITLQIKLKNDTSRFLPPGQTISFELPWTPRHICGVTGGFYFGTLHNTTYTNRFDSISATNKGYRLVKENTPPCEFGLNVLAYYDWKINNNKNYWYSGLAFGAGSSIESKPKPRVFVGFNFANGMNNRFLLTIGLYGGYVDRLSAAYSQDVLYVAAQNGYTIDKINIGGFLSLNYSF